MGKKIRNIIKKEAKEIKGILGKVKRRDFSGNTGQAVKNSSYYFSTILVAKAGSLLFTIMMARILIPELFGLYSLALSTIIMFTVFSDLGISSAMITFVSKSLGKKKEGEAKGYFKLLLRWRIFLVLGITSVLLIFSKVIAENYYQKPIFLALLAGTLYILITQTLSILDTLFQSANFFKPLLYKEIIFQITRIILIPLVILIMIDLSSEALLSVIIITLTLAYIFPVTYLLILGKKIHFLSNKEKKISQRQEKKLSKFVFPLSAMALSGFLFGYIDMIMLGKFVSGEFIGYYSAALGIMGSILAVLAFSSAALFPILGRLPKERLERGFRKSRRIVTFISLSSFMIVLLLAPSIIKAVYPDAYLPAINIFRILSLLILSFPLSNLYQTYYLSQAKSKIVSVLLISSTILNIVLTYTLITILAPWGGYYSVIGAALASVISRYTYLISLVLWRRKEYKPTR